LNELDRARAMAASVERAARAHGLAPAALDLVGRAYELGMRTREGVLDEHDPAYLHPGRSVLVLLQDVGPLPGVVLAAAAAHESEDARFRVALGDVRAELGDDVADLVASLPLPGDEDLAERLVTLDVGVRLAALAERLDILRHAHLRHDPAWWRALDEEVRKAWAPVAERTHPRLADRYRAWLRAMGRRLGVGAD
jgi:(p)ppGpp synthase/HD superfamily hydrolase